MVGTMADVVFADAIVKNIVGFDHELGYEAIRKDAYEIPPEGVNGIGRVCLESYLSKGYIPRGSPMTTGGPCTEVVSRSLNYLQSDWAIAQAAKALGKVSDAAELESRASNYSQLWHFDTGFFRSKEVVTERWSSPFDQFAWGDPYTEGGPWQYKFYVPYDPKGLADLFSSSGRNICDELQRAQTMQPTFHVGYYSNEIHEQTELPEHCWGQYSHNNQPVHYMLYMFQASDPSGYSGQCAKQGSFWLRKTMRELYKPGNDMFSGDEDNGSMSAWFVLSSLGLYSLAPGSPEYQLGTPLFSKVVIDVGAPIPLTIVANNNSPDNKYVKKVYWNGKVLSENASSISYATLMMGGTLTFDMTGGQ